MLKSAFVIFVLCSAALAQSAKARENYDKAVKEVGRGGHLNKAEKLLKEAIADSPTWALAYAELGDVYFYMPKEDPAVEAYTQARELDFKDHSLALDRRRVVNNNLAYVLASTKEYEKSIAVLEPSIKDDPEYGAYVYNLACDYSEMGDLDKALTLLKHAWELRDSFVFPNILVDSSFGRWRNDPRFQQATRAMVK